jgi:hypothetical protein
MPHGEFVAFVITMHAVFMTSKSRFFAHQHHCLHAIDVQTMVGIVQKFAVYCRLHRTFATIIKLLCMGVFLWCRYDVKDFGESVGNNLCTIVALFSLYQQAFMYWVLVTLSVEVCVCVVHVNVIGCIGGDIIMYMDNICVRFRRC